MDILERNRILNELQQQLASGEITIGGAVRRLRKEVTGLQQVRFAQMCKLSLRALRQLELDETVSHRCFGGSPVICRSLVN